MPAGSAFGCAAAEAYATAYAEASAEAHATAAAKAIAGCPCLESKAKAISFGKADSYLKLIAEAESLVKAKSCAKSTSRLAHCISCPACSVQDAPSWGPSLVPPCTKWQHRPASHRSVRV